MVSKLIVQIVGCLAVAVLFASAAPTTNKVVAKTKAVGHDGSPATAISTINVNSGSIHSPPLVPAPRPRAPVPYKAAVNEKEIQALNKLLALESSTLATDEACDLWQHAIEEYKKIAGPIKFAKQARPHSATKNELCGDKVDFLNIARQQIEELSVHLNDYVQGTGDDARLDLMAALVEDQLELDVAFDRSEYIKNEFDNHLQTDPRLVDDYPHFLKLLNFLRDKLPTPLATQLQNHPDFTGALNELHRVLPELHTAAGSAEGVLAKLRAISGIPEPELAELEAEAAEFGEQNEEEPIPVPVPVVPRRKISDLKP